MRAFIFDMDGVIIDSEPLHAEVKRQTLEHYGFAVDDAELVRYVGRTTRSFFQSVITDSGRTDVNAEDMTEYKHRRYLAALQGKAGIEPINGIPELLAKLKKMNIKTGLASSADPVIIEAVLTRFGVKDKFQVVISGTEIPRSKPDPAIYLLTAERLMTAPEECVVLEDSQSGIAAAKAAGMYCIAYRNPDSGAQDLSKADRIVDKISEIDLTKL